MTGELKYDFLQFESNTLSNSETTQEVRLKLYCPRLFSKVPSLIDLYDLQQRCPIIKEFSFESTNDSTDEKTVILCFQTVEDAVDFQQEQKFNLTFSMALFQTEDQQHLVKTLSTTNKAQCLEKQLDQEGFCLKNGKISLNRQTSMEDLIKQNCMEHIDEQSTIVQTDRKISICEEIDKQIGSSGEEYIQEVKGNHGGYIKSILDGLMVTGVMYGGFKLLKYFMKM